MLLVYIGRSLRNSGVERRFDQIGFLYRHEWETGFQDLVFRTHGDAIRFASNNGVRYEGPKQKK